MTEINNDDFDKRFDELCKPKALEPADADQLVLDICDNLPFVDIKGGHLTYHRPDNAPQVLFDIAPDEAVEIEQAARRAGHADTVVTDDLDDEQASADDRLSLRRYFDTPVHVLAAQKAAERNTQEAMQAAPKITIQVYLTNGVVREYEVADHATAREHMFEIVMTGYRSVDESNPNLLVHWPPHKIVKVKAVAPTPFQTRYFDRARGT